MENLKPWNVCRRWKGSFSNQKGFSLIELMVVVAIIGLLAAIAIPNYQRFQRRARQAEAKSVLAALYSAERAFITEWSYGTMNLDLIGYDSSGEPFYVAGWNDNDDTEKGNTINSSTQPPNYRGPVPQDTTNVNTFQLLGATVFHTDAGTVNGTMITAHGACGAATGAGTCACGTAPGCTVQGSATPGGTCGGCAYGADGVDNTTTGINNIGFTIGAAANLGGNQTDEWTINQEKALSNTKSGL